MSDRARPGEADEALERFEEKLATRLRCMAQDGARPELEKRGLAFVRSQHSSSQHGAPRENGAADAGRVARER